MHIIGFGFMDTIVNKVAQSGIITLDLKTFIPTTDQFYEFDLKPFLFHELLLREKDFRAAMNEYDWSKVAGKHLSVYCSSDAIIPMWAYMLIASKAQQVAASVYFGSVNDHKNHLLLQAIAAIDVTTYDDARVVIKGCGEESISEAAFLNITYKLQPVVKSLMYGEPCSTVPIYKKK